MVVRQEARCIMQQDAASTIYRSAVADADAPSDGKPQLHPFSPTLGSARVWPVTEAAEFVLLRLRGATSDIIISRSHT